MGPCQVVPHRDRVGNHRCNIRGNDDFAKAPGFWFASEQTLESVQSIVSFTGMCLLGMCLLRESSASADASRSAQQEIQIAETVLGG